LRQRKERPGEHRYTACMQREATQGSRPTPLSTPATEPLAWYRQSPYLIFFPLGAALSLSGVLPWGLLSLGHFTWRPALHALTEVQGALTSFAIGFLFTFVPRRTGTPLPTTAECIAALVLLFPPPLLALFEHERLAQASWAVLALFLAFFVFTRLRKGLQKGQAVSQLLWLPSSFAMALAGSLLSAAAGPGRPYWLSPLGTSLVWQGMLGGLVAGIGGMLLPMLFHREPHKGDRSARSWWLNGAGCVLFASSFALEWAVNQRLGYGLRGAVLLAALLGPARLARPPRAEGVHRWFAWVAAWMIPLGFLAVALWPMHRIGLLHLTFLSGFTLLTLSVANHVTLAHGGRDPLLFSRPLPLLLMFGLVLLATTARVLVTLDPSRMLLWIGTAFWLYAGALISWAAWVLPRLKPLPKAVDRPVEAR
jgi:uncharacterized protein involved in response to NO